MNKGLHLNIGGGTDSKPWWIEGNGVEAEATKMFNLRSFFLALENPETTYVVIDTDICLGAASIACSGLENIAFILGDGSQLPFRDESVSTIEVNHLFFPVTTADITRREQELETRKAAASDDDHELRTSLEEEDRLLEADAEQRYQLVLSETATEEDLSDYFDIVRAASRALQPGGTLLLSEKFSRMMPIERILKQNNDLLLSALGLELTYTGVNELDVKSRYAQRARKQYDHSGGSISSMPMLVEMTKI
ncbi:MAG: hypothetical protein AAF413_00795 [Patescibacteria group bacterium]